MDSHNTSLENDNALAENPVERPDLPTRLLFFSVHYILPDEIFDDVSTPDVFFEETYAAMEESTTNWLSRLLYAQVALHAAVRLRNDCRRSFWDRRPSFVYGEAMGIKKWTSIKADKLYHFVRNKVSHNGVIHTGGG